MRKIAANYIFPVSGKPIQNGILVLDLNETIVEILDNEPNIENDSSIEFYNGVLVPGFVNAHCHVELSYLRNRFRKAAGMENFLKQIVSEKKTEKPTDYKEHIERADGEMFTNGIAAVGDISNNDFSFKVKRDSKLHYHTFVELSSLNPERAEATMKRGEDLYNLLKKKGLSASIVPHAPYSDCTEILQRIGEHAQNQQTILSIHNQECESENELYLSNSGKLFDLMKELGIENAHYEITGVSSLQSILCHFSKSQKILLVHNLFTSAEDIDFCNQYFENQDNITWVFCPNSNLFIQNILPNFDLFRAKSQNITIGTDSLVSNDTLSIFDEMKTIAKNFPHIEFEEILRWCTLNGAKALDINNIGSFEIGKKPRVNLIQHFDFQKMTINDKSNLKSIV